MLQLKKLTAYFKMWAVCVCLCACSRGEDNVILIGAEEDRTEDYGTVVPMEGASVEKNRKKEREQLLGEGGETSVAETIRVYVCGAVVYPGVVEIPADSRVEDALNAAGGFTEEASHVYVNLAAWTEDGQMLYIPTEEEIDSGEMVLEQFRQSGMVESDAGGTDLVNINTAGVESLCSLPGIGESRAADIIAYREANGFFESCEDIMHVPGIKTGLYEKISDRITVK